jgi:hypothetical protein
MSETVYQFRSASRFRGDAALVVAELERIRVDHGALQSATIVEAASPEDAPLHPFFEWDDAAAAHAHRLDTARRLVRSIEVMRADLPPVAMYVHYAAPDIGTPEGGYERQDVILTRPDRYLSAIAETQRDMASIQRRLSELLGLAKSAKKPEIEVARILLAVQALETANSAIAALH